jgi:hypothetical protein
MIDEYELTELAMVTTPELIETSDIVVSIVIGFGLTLLIGFISWAISISIRAFAKMINGR